MGGCYSHMVFFPPEPASYSVDDADLVRFPMARNGTLSPSVLLTTKITFVPSHGGTSIPVALLSSGTSPPKRTVLLSHGNAEDLGHMLPYAEELSFLLPDTQVVIYDYSSYGRARNPPPKPTERALYHDITAVYKHVTETLGVDPATVYLFGRSLGSGPTLFLAQRTPGIAGVVLISPIASCIRVVVDTKCITLPGDMFPNIRRVKKVRVPVLVVHGTADELVHCSHGERLYEKARIKVDPLWVQGGDHNSIETDARPQWKKEVLARYQAFFTEVENVAQ